MEINLINLIDLISKQIPSTKSQFGHFHIGNYLDQLEIRPIRNFKER